MKYDTVIFDLDGTLLDTLRDLGEAVNHALSIRSLPLHSTEAYRRKVGHGIRNLVKVSLPEEMQENQPLIDSALSDFREYYSSHIDEHTRPYPGIPELLDTLRDAGVSMAVASNKFQEGAERLAKKMFPGIPFAAILGNRPSAPLKPDPAIVSEILQICGKKGSAIMVGDSATDIHTAHNGGIQAIAVTWGYRPEADFGEADFIAHTPSELGKLLF